MITQIEKKENTKKSNTKAIVTAVTGVIVGAGAAVAGAIVLNKKKNRDKITTAVSTANNHTKEKMDKVEKKVKKILA